MFLKRKDRTERKEKKRLKRELKARNRKKKESIKLKKKYLTTLGWCDIREVKDDEIIIRKERSKTDYHVRGIKITPQISFLMMRRRSRSR